MKLSAELAALKMKALAPLDTATGFQIFETALRAGEPQIAGLILTDTPAPASLTERALPLTPPKPHLSIIAAAMAKMAPSPTP